MAQPILCDADPTHGDGDFMVTTLATGEVSAFCVGCFIQYATAVADSLLAAMEAAKPAAGDGGEGGGEDAAPRPRRSRRVAVHDEPDPPPPLAAPEEQAATG